MNRSIRSSEIKRGTKNEGWKERESREEWTREKEGEVFAMGTGWGGRERGDTETKYMYMTAPSGDKYVKESKRAARGTKNEKKRERKERER